MAPETGDLRSYAKDVQRVRNHKYKWARTAVSSSYQKTHEGVPGEKACADCWDKPVRPVKLKKPMFSLRSSAPHDLDLSTPSSDRGRVGRGRPSAKKQARRDMPSFTTSAESSAAEEDIEVSAAIEAGADVMYSYDATHGPNGGSQVLGFAINQAVERFENKQTEQIAREYEFVDGKDGYVADEDEEDFEIVDESSFR